MKFCVQNGKLIKASADLPNRDGYTCPSCKQEMGVRRISATNTGYFAHIERGNCKHDALQKDVLEIVDTAIAGLIYAFAKYGEADD